MEAVACTVLDGRPVAVTAGYDGTVRVWDLHTRTAVAELLLDQPRAAVVTSTGDLVSGFHNDITLYRRQPRGLAPQSW
ncbi:hypothetical protein ACFTUC_02700 [Streptomyces sp. NPDC056944]|uniref:hypothetical protein n=1 Tax=Streptomyces sp. NPDC056944 TaxID=3345972 RepID=UPI00362D55EE